MNFTALPSPHTKGIALHSERGLIALLTPREALDLAATLIKAREALYAPAGTTEQAA